MSRTYRTSLTGFSYVSCKTRAKKNNSQFLVCCRVLLLYVQQHCFVFSAPRHCANLCAIRAPESCCLAPIHDALFWSGGFLTQGSLFWSYCSATTGVIYCGSLSPRRPVASSDRVGSKDLCLLVPVRSKRFYMAPHRN